MFGGLASVIGEQGYVGVAYNDKRPQQELPFSIVVHSITSF